MDRLKDHTYVAMLAKRRMQYRHKFDKLTPVDARSTLATVVQNIHADAELYQLVRAIIRIDNTLDAWAKTHSLKSLYGNQLKKLKVSTI